MVKANKITMLNLLLTIRRLQIHMKLQIILTIISEMLDTILLTRSITKCIPSLITINRYTLLIAYIEETYILNVLFSLTKSATGYDGIPGSFMEQCAHQYLTALTYIINCSILEAYFP